MGLRGLDWLSRALGSHVQIHVRDISGFVDTREQMLHEKPNSRANWIALAMGHFLAREYEPALKVLTSYMQTLDETPKEGSESVEHSEILLFWARNLYCAGKLEDAVGVLEKHAPNMEQGQDGPGSLSVTPHPGGIWDYLAMLELLADVYSAMGGQEASRQLQEIYM